MVIDVRVDSVGANDDRLLEGKDGIDTVIVDIVEVDEGWSKAARME